MKATARWLRDGWRGIRVRFSLVSDLTRAGLATAGAFALLFGAAVYLRGVLVDMRGVPLWVILMMVFLVVLFSLYAALTMATFARLGPEALVAAIDASEDSRNPRLERWLAVDQLSWMLSAAGFGLLLVATTVTHPQLRSNPWALGGAALLVALSWLLMMVAGSVHLLRVDRRRDALRFPDDGPRVFADYFYVAVTLFTTFATSDVSATSTRCRRAFTVMSISAMVFNTVVIALLVSGVITLASS